MALLFTPSSSGQATFYKNSGDLRKINNGFTAAFWVKHTTFGIYADPEENGSIFSLYDSDLKEMSFYAVADAPASSTAKYYLQMAADYSNKITLSSLSVTLNKWFWCSFAIKPGSFGGSQEDNYNVTGKILASPVDSEIIYREENSLNAYGNPPGIGAAINKIILGRPSWSNVNGTDGGYYCLDGALAFVRIWDDYLSDEELINEKWAYYPKRGKKLYSVLTLDTPSIYDMGIDISGNNNNFTIADNASAWTVKSAIDGPPVSVGAQPLVLATLSEEEKYGLNISAKQNSGSDNAPKINCGTARAGEKQIISLNYIQATPVATPANWQLLSETVSGSVRNSIFYRILGNDVLVPETVTFSLGAAGNWTVHALTTVGRIGNSANLVTSSANTAAVPSINIPHAGDYWLHFLTNVTGNCKTYFNNSDPSISIISSASANSNVIAGLTSIVAVKKVNSSGVITTGNIWHIYDSNLSKGPLSNSVPRVSSRTQSNVFDSISLNNQTLDISSPEEPVNYLWKQDAANVLNYNAPYTIMFDYYHIPSHQPTYGDQNIWTLTRRPGMYYGSISAMDALIVRPNDDLAFFLGHAVSVNERGADSAYGALTQFRWNHIALTSDGFKRTVYLNGNVSQTFSFNTASRVSIIQDPEGENYTDVSTLQYFGCMQYGFVGTNIYSDGVYRAKGSYSNIKEWNKELTPGEILEEMNSKEPKTHANLFAWYPTESTRGVVNDMLKDRVGTKHLMLTLNTPTGNGPLANVSANPIKSTDITIVSSITLTAPAVKRGLYVSSGNIREIPQGSEKTGNIITLQSDGTIKTANLRNANFYSTFPSGRAIINDAGNIRSLNANTDILIR